MMKTDGGPSLSPFWKNSDVIHPRVQLRVYRTSVKKKIKLIEMQRGEKHSHFTHITFPVKETNSCCLQLFPWRKIQAN